MLLKIEELAPPPRAPAGWALWALGFRPFYLLAAVFAALSVPLWALQWSGWLGTPYLAGPLWHAHEMLFGYALAVVVGFLFTAGRNWSGQPTPTGPALMTLAALWLAGRVLVLTPWGVAAALVNVAFAWVAAAALWRALHAANNRRNYFFVAVLVALGLAEALMHANRLGLLVLPEALGVQIGLDLLLFVMAVMAGRVVPMFTNNGVPGAQARRVEWVERVALGTVLALLAADLLRAPALLLAPLLLLATAAHGARWALWQPWTTLRHPLVWVLHAAYLWVPLHLALRAGALAGWLPG